MKLVLTSLLVYLSFFSLSQKDTIPTLDDALHKFGFHEGRAIANSDTDTVFYYWTSADSLTKPRKLVVFIQGTDAHPLFSYTNELNGYQISRWFSDDYKLLDSSYMFAIVPKPAMEGIFNESELRVPEAYYEHNYLDYRVHQLDASINDILSKHMDSTESVIVYGHSEGAAIGAALALKNKAITHLGFWSGNVLNNFYEFTLFNRIESLQGTLSDSLAHENIMGIMSWYELVVEAPNATDLDHFGFTNKRWSSYETPPIDHLLELEIPIYAYFATEDESTPIETAYLLPVRFIEHRKNNLTFNVCIGCDHAYQELVNDVSIDHWKEVFVDFIEWTEQSK